MAGAVDVQRVVRVEGAAREAVLGLAHQRFARRLLADQQRSLHRVRPQSSLDLVAREAGAVAVLGAPDSGHGAVALDGVVAPLVGAVRLDVAHVAGVAILQTRDQYCRLRPPVRDRRDRCRLNHACHSFQ